VRNDPEGQKEAPRTVGAVQGAKTNNSLGSGENQGMFPSLVKSACAACFTCNAWPTWLGAQWLRSAGVRR